MKTPKLQLQQEHLVVLTPLENPVFSNPGIPRLPPTAVRMNHERLQRHCKYCHETSLYATGLWSLSLKRCGLHMTQYVLTVWWLCWPLLSVNNTLINCMGRQTIMLVCLAHYYVMSHIRPHNKITWFSSAARQIFRAGWIFFKCGGRRIKNYILYFIHSIVLKMDYCRQNA
jgi:hypothetical protein